MPVTRRDLLFSLGGGVAGTLLSPLPWKLLDDVSIWTQHRPGLPIPPAGEVAFQAAACTLCPAGCALRVRSVGGRPVFAAPMPRHPQGAGACAFGLTLHQLARHPQRTLRPLRIDGLGQPVAITLGAAVGTVRAALARAARDGRTVLVLDQRPGRVASQAYREFAASLPAGIYAAPADEGATLATLQAAQPPSCGPLGVDLERTRTLLSFGAPVLDGWDRPGRVLACRDGLRVVQLDVWRSPSAALADEWLVLRPDAAGPLALALAHVVTRERLVPAPPASVAAVLADFTPEQVAARVGLEPARITALARSLVAQGPTVAIGGGDPGGGPLPKPAERAIALLDQVLGSVGRPGGIVARRPLPDVVDAPPPVADLTGLPRASVGLLLLDAADSGRALPWTVLARSLAPDALVVSLSPFRSGIGQHAELIVPAPAPLESIDEVLPTPVAGVGSYGLSAALLTPPAGATEPLEFLARVAAAAELPPVRPREERLRQRVAAIHASRRGRFMTRGKDGFAEAVPASAEALWQGLLEGGCWLDDAAGAAPDAGEPLLPGAAAVARWQSPVEADTAITLVTHAPRGAAGSTPAAPILSKLYQETDLRPSPATAAAHPETARRLGLRERATVRIESSAGVVAATLRHDPSLAPGLVVVAAGPDAALHRLEPSPEQVGGLALAVVREPDLTWRGTRIAVREA